jgi:hypothetical protein
MEDQIMSKLLKIFSLTVIVSASIIGGASGHANAAPSVKGTGELACPYKYVVSDGKPNNVTAYKGPRGTATQRAIRPNERFIVFTGSGDRVGGRQRTDHGWVSFPRSYLHSTGPCVSALSQAAAEAAAIGNAANQALGDVGRSLGNAARPPR